MTETLESYSKDLVICYFVNKHLEPLGFHDLFFEKRREGHVEITDSVRGDPDLVMGAKVWEPIRKHIFNEIKMFLASPENAAAYIKTHEAEFAAIAEKFRHTPKFTPAGPLGHHLG